jgi:predicted enzyme related to lactoylglutathione lyase
MKGTIISLVVASVAFAGTETATPHGPPPSQTAGQAQATVGEFVWHDLVTDDPASSRVFYGALFGWTFEAGAGVDSGYTIIKHGKRPVGGIVRRRESSAGGSTAQWLSYLVVGDVDRTADAFRAAGGRVLRGPLDARKDLRVAAVADAQGAALGLASRGPYVETAVSGLHEWLWMEYVARDADGALRFLSDVIGYRHEIAETREHVTYYVLSTDRPRAGLFKTLWEREQSAWLPYIRVEDPFAMAGRVATLGGTVVIAPQPRVRNSSLAVVLDPSGAVFALQKYPFDAGGTP